MSGQAHTRHRLDRPGHPGFHRFRPRSTQESLRGTGEGHLESEPDEDSTGLTVELKSEEHFTTSEFAFRLRDEPDQGNGPKSVTEAFNM